VEVGRHEQRVVVEHLLEVRHEPPLVDRVAVEAAADEVVHAAGGHRVEGLRRHVRFPAPEQQLQHRGGRELRCSAEASVLRVEELAEAAHGGEEERLGQRLRGRRRRGCLLERL
jgi:hypothetical protein